MKRTKGWKRMTAADGADQQQHKHQHHDGEEKSTRSAGGGCSGCSMRSAHRGVVDVVRMVKRGGVASCSQRGRAVQVDRRSSGTRGRGRDPDSDCVALGDVSGLPALPPSRQPGQWDRANQG